MPVIHLLPKPVVERIAAGEVIERPASVVKEAVENAVDACATQIKVEIEDGGRKLIRVSDDGVGLDADDLPLAFTSHATSKITDVDDLFSVKTMGFRGEALPSIAAVAHVAMVSRPHLAETGHIITLYPDRDPEVRAAPAAAGSVLEVTNLFFNVPVRRKFLKSDATEAGHVADAISRIALAHPEVSFELLHNGRQTISTPAVTDLKDRIREIFGRQLAGDLIEAAFDDGYVKLRGFVSSPSFTRSNSRQQFVFLNRRHIRDKLVLHAVAAAYADFLPRGRFPVTFLYIAMPHADVDVNVHPTKIEVRFRNAGAVHHAAQSAVHHALASSDLTPSLTASPAVPSSPTVAEPPAPGSSPAAPLFTPDTRERARRAIEARFADAEAPAPVLHQVPPARPEDPQKTLPSTPVDDSPLSKAAVQIHDTYIVVETDDGFTVIDQHALHERVLYEQLRDRIAAAPLPSQRLLVPIQLELTQSEFLTIEANGDLLESLGMEIGPFGSRASGAAAVYAYPSILADADIAAVVTDLLGELADDSHPAAAADRVDRILHVLACRAAVKAGDRLSDEEIRSLLKNRGLAQNPFNCPHGRPAALNFSLNDIEKQFRRT